MNLSGLHCYIATFWQEFSKKCVWRRKLYYILC